MRSSLFTLRSLSASVQMRIRPSINFHPNRLFASKINQDVIELGPPIVHELNSGNRDTKAAESTGAPGEPKLSDVNSIGGAGRHVGSDGRQVVSPTPIDSELQAPDDHSDSLTDAIKLDHTLIKRLIDLFESSKNLSERREAIHSLVKELSQHSAAEEMLLYPLYDFMTGTGQNRKESLDEHQKIKNSLYEVDNTDINDPNFGLKFDALKKATLKHVTHEEATFLPAFDREIAKFPKIPNFLAAWKILKSAAPTRPHPSAPTSMPGLAVAGIAARVVDSIKDAAQGRR